MSGLARVRHTLRRGRSAPRRRRTRWAVAVPVAAVGAGAIFGISAATSQGTDLRPATRNLVQVVRNGDRTVQEKAAEVKALQASVNALTAARAPGSAKIAALRRQGDAIAARAGMTTVRGSAVSVTLDDSHRDPSTLPADTDPNWLLVHQQDVQGVVNALWRGGATAMTIMDQRVISTSAVRCVGNTLLLQGRVYSPPFTITAMGDQSRLRSALTQDDAVSNFRDYVSLVGLGYAVRDLDAKSFPAYDGSTQLRYATSYEDAR
ncbi:MAG: DUF881 domain-containing protein [Allobranchiibius sp.]